MRKIKRVKVAQSCPTLCDPMDCTVHGILQARILEWVAFPFSREGTGALSVSTESSPEDVRKFLERVFQTVGCMPHVLKAGKEWNRRY